MKTIKKFDSAQFQLEERAIANESLCIDNSHIFNVYFTKHQLTMITKYQFLQDKKGCKKRITFRNLYLEDSYLLGFFCLIWSILFPLLYTLILTPHLNNNHKDKNSL